MLYCSQDALLAAMVLAILQIKRTGRHSSVLQAGNVVLEDEVEIGNNTCIDRATAGSTIVGAGTKIRQSCAFRS